MQHGSSLRLALGWILLAVTLAAGTASHRHSGFGDESAGGERTSSLLTTHNPASVARHWHAVLRVVQEDPCWACQWQRLFGLPITAAPSLPVLSACPIGLLPPRSARSVARFTRLSRGPPVLF